jgi:hypothetical protein
MIINWPRHERNTAGKTLRTGQVHGILLAHAQ